MQGTFRKVALTGLGVTMLYVLAILECVSPAQAASAKSFVSSLEGKWRGGGTLIVSNAGRKVKVRCVLRNKLNKASRKLVLSGRCASSNGSRPMSGSLTYAASGNRISGTISSGISKSQTTKSTASFNGRNIILSSRIYDEKTNRTERIRSIISARNSRFSMSVQFNQGSGWKKRGNIIFKK